MSEKEYVTATIKLEVQTAEKLIKIAKVAGVSVDTLASVIFALWLAKEGVLEGDKHA